MTHASYLSASVFHPMTGDGNTCRERENMALMRLDKLLSAAAGISRTEAKAMLRAGRVRMDGGILTDGAIQLEETAELTLNGRPIQYRKHVYLMMYKPAGIVSATEDRRDRTALDLLPEELQRLELFPAGRLDKDATGLLILTNDGEFCHRVISPKQEVWKRYLAMTAGPLLPEHAARFQAGLLLEDGFHCLPAGLEILRSGEESECIVTLREGKFHQVKRMLAACGAPVRQLHRISIGGLELDPNLAPGESRELTEEELDSVFSRKVTNS